MSKTSMVVQANQHLTVDAETNNNDDNRTIASYIMSHISRQDTTLGGHISTADLPMVAPNNFLGTHHFDPFIIRQHVPLIRRRIGIILIALRLSEEFRLREWRKSQEALGEGEAESRK
jgi:hypothetical protein